MVEPIACRSMQLRVYTALTPYLLAACGIESSGLGMRGGIQNRERCAVLLGKLQDL